MATHSAYGRSTLKLFRKVQNDFVFLIRDIDRQPVVLPGTLIFHIWDDNGLSILSKPMAVVNAKRGHYRLGVAAEDTGAIRSGMYVWSVTNTDAAVTKLLYTNQDYGTQGIIDVSEGVYEPANAPYTMDSQSMTPLGGEYYSSAMPGASRVGNLTGNHTVVAYLNKFTGKVTVKASIDEQAPNDERDWVDVDVVEFNDVSGSKPISFTGNFTHVKFYVTAHPGFIKLVYRN